MSVGLPRPRHGDEEITTQELRSLAAAVLHDDVQTLARTSKYLRRSYRVVFIGYIGMMVFGVADPSQCVDESGRLVVVLEVERLLDRAVVQMPAVHLVEVRVNLIIIHRLAAFEGLASAVQEIGHGVTPDGEMLGSGSAATISRVTVCPMSEVCDSMRGAASVTAIV